MVKRRGFTLLELLIVIGLIGILIAISVSSYVTIQKKSRDSRRMSDLKAIQNALEQYYADNTAYYYLSYINEGYDDYFSGDRPKDPKTSCYYRHLIHETDEYKICADLEGVGAYDCTGANCTGVGGDGCDEDFCVRNLQ